MTNKKYRSFLLTEILAQRNWIEQHGGSLNAYVRLYGDPGHEHCFGEGGTAIYQADTGRLEELKRNLASLG